jgi:hypothetical protein
MKEIIKLEIEYDKLDEAIITALKQSDLTVYQIHGIVSHLLHMNIPSMNIVRKLDYLMVINKVTRKKKNSRIYIYSLT